MIRKMVRFIGQKEAQLLDEQLMSSEFGFSIEQLMEAAGLSVACAIGKEFPISQITDRNANILVLAGPGNNGGDALVAARYLKLFGYIPSIMYPKANGKKLFENLLTQCRQFQIPILCQPQQSSQIDERFSLILDGIFGFSFHGEIRPPFDSLIHTINGCKAARIISIDIPSGWDVERGDVDSKGLNPLMLVSLSAPKLCAQKHHDKPGNIHYLGGRFIPRTLEIAFDLQLPSYPGTELCVKL